MNTKFLFTSREEVILFAHTNEAFYKLLTSSTKLEPVPSNINQTLAVSQEGQMIITLPLNTVFEAKADLNNAATRAQAEASNSPERIARREAARRQRGFIADTNVPAAKELQLNAFKTSLCAA